MGCNCRAKPGSNAKTVGIMTPQSGYDCERLTGIARPDVHPLKPICALPATYDHSLSRPRKSPGVTLVPPRNKVVYCSFFDSITWNTEKQCHPTNRVFLPRRVTASVVNTVLRLQTRQVTSIESSRIIHISVAAHTCTLRLAILYCCCRL
jgi:hypothetical protein